MENRVPVDKHTFIGRRQLGVTQVSAFTDFQGLGQDPLYKRYDSVASLVARILPQYKDFLAAPHYSPQEDVIKWYVPEWKETPMRLADLCGESRRYYEGVLNATVAAYRATLSGLSGEELMVMAGALRYINPGLVFCADGKVYVVAWGMTPDPTRHIDAGVLVQKTPADNMCRVTFDAGAGKTSGTPTFMVERGHTLDAAQVPGVEAPEGKTFSHWSPDPVGAVIDKDTLFTATYNDAASETVLIPPVIDEPALIPVDFVAGTGGRLEGTTHLDVPAGSHITAAMIPKAVADKKFESAGWEPAPLNRIINGPAVFTASFRQKKSWWARNWRWLRWLLLALGGLLLLWLLWLLLGTIGCVDSCCGGVRAGADFEIDGEVSKDIPLFNGNLPDSGFVAAPVTEPDGKEPPVSRKPGLPPSISNRLILFLEEDNGSVDALAAAFKQAYPGDGYQIIGFDREVGMVVVRVPDGQRDAVRDELPSKITNQRFFVFDELLYETVGEVRASQAAGPLPSYPQTAGWNIQAVHAPRGWAITQGSPDVTIAVIDDGCDVNHPVLKGRIRDPYNVYTQKHAVAPGPHGTAVASLAAGSLQMRAQGVAGIAPKARIMPVQVFQKDMCPMSALVAGTMYAIKHDAQVINLSVALDFEGLENVDPQTQETLATNEFKLTERLWQRITDIAARKNAVLVWAAGNNDILSKVLPENRPPRSIVTGAVDNHLVPTDFTNWGMGTSVSAPGQRITVAAPGGGTAMVDGTSFSAPIVSGTVALMKSIRRDITPQQAVNVMYRTGQTVYGAMPPMVLVDRALEGVQSGDFSRGPERMTVSTPDEYLPDDPAQMPVSYRANPGVSYDATPHTGVEVRPISGTGPGTIDYRDIAGEDNGDQRIVDAPATPDNRVEKPSPQMDRISVEIDALLKKKLERKKQLEEELKQVQRDIDDLNKNKRNNR